MKYLLQKPFTLLFLMSLGLMGAPVNSGQKTASTAQPGSFDTVMGQVNPWTVPAQQRAFINPRTGQLVENPPSENRPPRPLPAQANDRESQADHRLPEIPGTTPAGGMKIDLGNNHFHSLKVIIDDNKQVKLHCQEDSHASNPGNQPFHTH